MRHERSGHVVVEIIPRPEAVSPTQAVGLGSGHIGTQGYSMAIDLRSGALIVILSGLLGDTQYEIPTAAILNAAIDFDRGRQMGTLSSGHIGVVLDVDNTGTTIGKPDGEIVFIPFKS